MARPRISARFLTGMVSVLVLLSFGLVLVATVLLVLGLLADSGLALIYLSIGCSIVAGILLVVATRMGRPRTALATAGASAEPVAPTPVPVSPIEDDTSYAPVAGDVVVADEVVEAVVVVEEEDIFPIADYDELSVPQILPLLPELYADEVDVVEARERSGKGRVEVLGRLAELREQLAGAPADATGAMVAVAPVTTEVPAVPAPAKKAAPAKKVPAKKAAAPAAKKAAPAKKAAAPVKKVAAAPVKKAAPAPVKKAAPAKKAAAPVKKVATKATKATKKA